MSTKEPTRAEILAIDQAAKSAFQHIKILPEPTHALNAVCAAAVLVIETSVDPKNAAQAKATAMQIGAAVFKIWSDRNT